MTSAINPQDHSWYESVVERYESRIVRYAARLIGDTERARDVAQDTFLQLCRQPRAAVQDKLASWLFTVCRNKALDVRKKESRMKTLDEVQADNCESREADHVAVLQRNEAAGHVAAVLDQLPQNQQEVIRLKVLEGLSYREISEVTGLSVSNVGFLLHKGIKALRQQSIAPCHDP